MYLIEQVAGRSRNVTFRISGTVSEDQTIEIKTEEPVAKLTAAAWLIEEKMGFYLGWEKESILMPLESRNSIRFDQAILCPKQWAGSLWLRPFKVILPEMAFLVILDLDK